MKIKKESVFDRRADARKKIMLGGLIVKAELDYMHPHNASILYGMLLDCKRALLLKPELFGKWKEMGKELLVSKLENKNEQEIKSKEQN